MRWLIAHPGPGFSVHDVFVGWEEALEELGEQTFEFNLDDRLVFYDRAYLLADEQRGLFRKALDADTAIAHALNGLAAAMWKLRPHVLLIVSGFFIDHDLLDHARNTGTRVVLLCTESPYEEDRQYELAKHVDVCVLNDPTNLAIYQDITETIYLPHAYRPSVHHPGPPSDDLICDLGFVGTGYPSRVEFFEAMDLNGLDVKLGGNWMRLDGTDSPLRKYLVHDIDGCLDNTDAADLYRSSRASLNLYRREAAHPELEQGWAMGPREVEMAACGLWFLRDQRPEGDETLPMLPVFADPGDAADKLRFYLAHDDRRREAALKARDAIADRTFANNANHLLRVLDKEQ